MTRKSDATTQAVFLTTPTAYFLVVVGYYRTGLILYLVFMGLSYIVGFFKRLPEWPLISKITLACGPPMLGLGYYFSTQYFTGGMFMPGYIYIATGLLAGYALRSLD